jgi:hypothetical protein
VTNFRVDHPAAHGNTPAEVARVLSLDVPPGSRVFVLEEEWEPAFGQALEQVGVNPVKVPAGEATAPERCMAFGPNLDLVWAAARALGVDEAAFREGVCLAREDVGALRVWRYPLVDSWLVVNAFAANDPDSTLRVYDRIMGEHGRGADGCAGLLNLRADRGDRTLQWVESLRGGVLERFNRLFVYGLHANALKFKLRREDRENRIRILRSGPPDGITGQIVEEMGGDGGIIFGFGNIAGLGDALVRHWRHVGEPVTGGPRGV